MDSSTHKLALLAAALTVCSAPAAQEGSDPQSSPISWEADSFSFDRKTDLIVFRGLRLTHGELSLQADQASATGLDFGSEWQFSGNVRIAVDSARLESDSATFTLDQQQLANAELRGSPAVFTDLNPDQEQRAEGGANRFSYDYAQRTLRMSENAWLSIGPHEIRGGCDLIYDFDEGQATSGSSDCGERFSITILPPPEDAATDSAPSP